MRYLLFSGGNYYPEGGWGDFIEAYPTVARAVKDAKSSGDDWWHVVDAATNQVVDHQNNHKAEPAKTHARTTKKARGG